MTTELVDKIFALAAVYPGCVYLYANVLSSDQTLIVNDSRIRHPLLWPMKCIVLPVNTLKEKHKEKTGCVSS